MKQNINTERLPLIVQIIHSYFRTQYIPEPFKSMNKEKIINAEMEITKKCFLEVIPRFKKFPNVHIVYAKNFSMDFYYLL